MNKKEFERDMQDLKNDVAEIKPLQLFAGTYTENNKSKGIYWYQMNPKSGELSFLSSCKTTNPSYLVVHPNKQWLFAVNETGGINPKSNGSISSFEIDQVNNRLRFINSVSSRGNYPCFLSIDHSGNFALLANYGTGNVAVFPVNSDGSLKEACSMYQNSGNGPTLQQDSPHAHMIVPGPGQLIYSTDLGTDNIILYSLDHCGKLLLIKKIVLKAGSGPRHITIHSNQKWLYVINELNGTIETFNLDKSTGDLSGFQIISTLPEGQIDFAGGSDIHISPSGKYLYASNRANINNIAIYKINQDSGELQLHGHKPVSGTTPRNFVIDPTGTFLLVANQDSNQVITFRIDAESGELFETGYKSEIPMPVCLKFLI
jgi:6-phosphogluconolactonase